MSKSEYSHLGETFVRVSTLVGTPSRLSFAHVSASAQPSDCLCFLLVCPAKNMTQMHAIVVELLYPSFLDIPGPGCLHSGQACYTVGKSADLKIRPNLLL